MLTRPRYARPSIRPETRNACRKYKGPYPLSGNCRIRERFIENPRQDLRSSCRMNRRCCEKWRLTDAVTESPAAQGKLLAPMSMPLRRSPDVIVIPLALSTDVQLRGANQLQYLEFWCLIEPGGSFVGAAA
ncbi:MAG: hypothetical protein IPN52_07910 [Micrococcales bacterium]|nr:hypothetical protein [Micrococcales bacterium]